jgi:hypothetical protein
MDYTYQDLKKMTINQLRELAETIDHEAVKGHTQLNKEQLLPAMCEALGIETLVHHEVVGIDKAKFKASIRELKVERDAALEAHDHKQLKIVRRKIHRLKRKIRRATV